MYEDDATLTLIEEYISGDTLQEIYDVCGIFNEADVINYAIQLCDICLCQAKTKNFSIFLSSCKTVYSKCLCAHNVPSSIAQHFIEFTELECPWYIDGDTVNIELSRLHCTITADIDENQLIFKSDSLNWNTEVFTHIDVSPEDYLTKELRTSDPNAILNSDGTLSYTLDYVSYTMPKTFRDMAI